jgi:hypothetical protein
MLRPAERELSRSRAAICLFGAALVFGTAAKARGQGPYSVPRAAEPQVEISVGRTAGSPWRLTVDPAEQRVMVRHTRYPGLEMDIDADGPEDDRRYEGITVVREGNRLEGTLYGNTVPFLSPDHDAGRTRFLRVQALDENLRVRFDGGSYRQLSAVGPDLPVFFEVIFFFDREHRLNGVMNGLYYCFPRASGSRVTVTSRQQEVMREFHPTTKKGYEYFEQIVKVEVKDPVYGDFRLEGLIERLQLESHGGQNAQVFEIDLDHAYKDRGQKEVLLRFQLMAPFTPVVSEGRVMPSRESGRVR